MNPHRPLPPASTQHGAVLVISLILLLVLSLLGLGAMRGALMSERMAGNLRDQQLALQAAEAALRAGENWLTAQTTPPSACLALGGGCLVYEQTVLPSGLDKQTPAWWETNAVKYGPELAGIATAPRYVVSQEVFLRDSYNIGHEDAKGRNIYRIGARGTGQTNEAEALLETIHSKRFD